MTDEIVLDENNYSNENIMNHNNVIAKRLSFGDVTASLRSTELPAGIGEVFRAASCAEPAADTLKRYFNVIFVYAPNGRAVQICSF